MGTMTRILAIDPGPEKSAWAHIDNGKIKDSALETNEAVLVRVNYSIFHVLAIEQIRSYGMSVGQTVFDTVHWCGRFHQEAITGMVSHPPRVMLLPRKEIVLHLCGNPRAKDGNVRQAIIDRLGEPRIPKVVWKVKKNGRTARKFDQCADAQYYALGREDCSVESCDEGTRPNPVYGLNSPPAADVWSAIAVGLTALDRLNT